MATLADLYSTIDTGKRRLKSFLQSPLESMALGVTRFGEDQASIQNLAANAYPMHGQETVLNSPDQRRQFQNELANKAVDQAMGAATVWHGSPHKFDKFDSSKIGTGEGAQAYGHGLYLAESRGVANNYKDMLTKMSIPDSVANKSEIHKLIADRVNRGENVFSVSDDIRRSVWRGHPEKAKEISDAAMEIAKLPTDNSLYKVDLPDEQIAKMLDWDKPLSQQHPDVQEIFNKNAPTYEDTFASSLATLGISMPEQVIKGQHIYERMGLGRDGAGASEALRKAGIPGIRYLDGGSRGAGKGTSNYVVFPGNENLLQILERNGVSLKK
jgi:hypothetical protein